MLSGIGSEIVKCFIFEVFEYGLCCGFGGVCCLECLKMVGLYLRDFVLGCVKSFGCEMKLCGRKMLDMLELIWCVRYGLFC